MAALWEFLFLGFLKTFIILAVSCGILWWSAVRCGMKTPATKVLGMMVRKLK
jgi:hypothetical protein